MRKNPTDPHHYFHSSESLVVPAEFQQYLFNREKSASIDARGLALNNWGRTAFFVLGRMLWEKLGAGNSLTRDVFHAGSKDRIAILDQIAYYDTYSQEPVWLFIYRGFRSRPGGSKPKKNKEQSADKEWLPGGLRPVGS